MGRWYTRAWLGWFLTDPTSGFRALGPRALEAIAARPPRSEGFAFQIETAFRVHERGLRVVEHPICFVDRAAGRSKMSMAIVAEALLVVPLLRLCSLVGA
jgi:dolichol-phosphate mannosyltransferase